MKKQTRAKPKRMGGFFLSAEWMGLSHAMDTQGLNRMAWMHGTQLNACCLG